MISATWFRKAKTPDPASAKDGILGSAATPASPIVEPATPTLDVTASTEAPVVAAGAAKPADTAKPTSGPVLRAARLVEAGRRSSTTLKARLLSALKQTEPWGRPAGIAAATLLVGAIGYAGGMASMRNGAHEDLVAAHLTAATASVREAREDTARLASEMRFLRAAVDGAKSERRGGDVGQKQAQLSDRVERSSADTAAKMAKLAEQLERIEKTQRDPARINALVERLERIEKQTQTASAFPAPTSPTIARPVAAATPAPAPADVTQTGSLPDPLPPARPVDADPRKLPADGYVLRDIEDGFALVEGRNGRFFEVSPGMNLPGLGRVETIERRGRQWVVVTPRGYIGER